MFFVKLENFVLVLFSLYSRLCIDREKNSTRENKMTLVWESHWNRENSH